MKAVFLVGRILFGGFFLYSGIHHFLQRKSMAQYAGAKQIPAPEAGVTLTGVMMLAGGASILLGLKPKLGAAAIVAFLAGVSPVMHDFWHVDDPGQRMNEVINFSKNLALLGAALLLFGVEEPWPASLPAAHRRSGPQRVLDFTRRLAS
jgi:putative oxidoreductase